MKGQAAPAAAATAAVTRPATRRPSAMINELPLFTFEEDTIKEGTGEHDPVARGARASATEDFMIAASSMLTRITLSAVGSPEQRRSSLSVNRELYRANRATRLAVLEASRRLEEEDRRRTREEMQRGRQGSPANRGVGLIIRHGGLIEHDIIEQLVAQQRREEQKRVGEAKETSGRSRRRDRTALDVRGMIGGPNAGRSDVTRRWGPPPPQQTTHPTRRRPPTRRA